MVMRRAESTARAISRLSHFPRFVARAGGERGDPIGGRQVNR